MSLVSTSLSDVHKAALRVCRVDLEDDLDVEHVMTRFRQKGIITQTMQDNILAERTPTMKCRTFLDMLETRGKDATIVFLTALNEAKYPHLADRLEREIALQSLTLAANSLRIANDNSTTLHKLMSKEKNVAICSSMKEVESLLAKLQKSLMLKEISERRLTLKCKIELSHSCMGLCAGPNGEIIIVEHEQGIIVYNKDLTFKFKFAVSMPTDVECLPTGEIVVSSRYNNCVKKYDNDGQYISDICDQVNEPHAMSYSEKIGLVVIGSKPECVYICEITGEIKQTIKKETFNFLYRVCINPYKEQILVSDLITSTLHCLDKDGDTIFTYKGQGDDRLNGRVGIYVMEEYILVTDTENHRVLLLSHEGDFIKNLLTREEHGFLSPAEVLVDSTGNILVGESHMAITGRNLLHVFKVDESDGHCNV